MGEASEGRAVETETGKRLEDLRAEIDDLDERIVVLLNQRAELSRAVGALKRRDGEVPVYQPHREAQIFARLDRLNRGPLSNADIRAVYREILSSSRALQRPIRVGFLGPIATFSYEAALRQFGSSAELVPCRTIADVFREAELGNLDYGIVPIENSTEGAVTSTFDRLVETNLKVCAELELPVTHNLLSNGTLGQITTVYSHPQPFAQCRRWLAENLPRATLIETASTALAAQQARAPETAAIATESAAREYDVPILVAHIEDVASNATRFLVIGPEMSRPTGNDQTAVMFTVKDHVGALHDALRSFAESGINLSRIESRPSRRKRWEYVFFVDLDGHAADPSVAMALERLEASASAVKVLGTWPRLY